MDEELRNYLTTMENRLTAMEAGLTAMEARLIRQINDGQERILNRLTSLERDFTNAKDFLVGDALVSSRRWLDLESRVTKLERHLGDGEA